jgi:hypothetical protein
VGKPDTVGSSWALLFLMNFTRCLVIYCH